MARIPPVPAPLPGGPSVAAHGALFGTAPPVALSPSAAYDERLQRLLEAAVPRLIAHAAPLRPRLLLLAGSGASGEASAVRLGGRFVPLSDLDLLLMTERPASRAAFDALRSAVARESAPDRERLEIARDPLDAGLFPLLRFYRAPLTLELAEAVERGVVLWGDPACLQPRRGESPKVFEAQRLLVNRVRETLAKVPGGFLSPQAPAWGAGPGEEDWRAAHRWAKFHLDAAKAWLAARGHHEPSIGKRAEAVRAVASRAVALRGGLPDWLPVIEAWAAWRLEPSWPPPAVDLAAASAIGREVFYAVARHAGLAEVLPVSPRAWMRLLEEEGGEVRERWRAWRSFVRARQGPAGAFEAARVALRWGTHAWPVSLIALSLALAWVDAGQAAGRGGGCSAGLSAGRSAGRSANGEEAEEGARLRRTMIREIPICRRLSAGAWDESWSAALNDWAIWAEGL